MTAWAHLPNAALIDEVLASTKTSPEKWSAAWTAAQAAPWTASRDAAWNEARNAAWDTARDAARNTAWSAARNAAWGAARSAARSATWDAAWGAAAMLIAYDDAGQFMKLPVEHLRRLHRIDPHPMFLLLQPAAIVFTEQRCHKE